MSQHMSSTKTGEATTNLVGPGAVTGPGTSAARGVRRGTLNKRCHHDEHCHQVWHTAGAELSASKPIQHKRRAASYETHQGPRTATQSPLACQNRAPMQLRVKSWRRGGRRPRDPGEPPVRRRIACPSAIDGDAGPVSPRGGTLPACGTASAIQPRAPHSARSPSSLAAPARHSSAPPRASSAPPSPRGGTRRTQER